MAGRKSKLTIEVRDRIAALLRAGNTRRAAAEASGISETRFYEWLAQGERQETGVFREFREAVQRAESESEILMVESVRKAARGYEKKTTRTKSRIEHVEGPDGEPLIGKDGNPVMQTVTETVEIIGFEFHPAMAIEWLKRRRREEWGDTLDIRKIPDDTLIALLERDAAARSGEAAPDDPPAGASGSG